MNKILISILLVLAFVWAAPAQYTNQPKFRGYLSANPSSCSRTGERYWNTSTLSEVYCTATGTPGTWSGSGAIGSTVSGATVGSVFYAGASGVLAQDNANFYRDSALFKVIEQETQTTGAFLFKFKGFNGAAYTEGLRIETTDPGSYAAVQIVLKSGAYSTDGRISTANNNGLVFASNANNVIHSFHSVSYTIAQFSDNAAYPTAKFIVNTNTQKGAVVKAAASQSADLFQVTDSSDNPLSGITGTGIVYGRSGAAVASAATITPTGNVFHVTGTTTITSVSGTGIPAGTCITMIFDGALTVTDNNGTLNTAGNFVTTADDTLSLCYDGTNWRETARSVN